MILGTFKQVEGEGSCLDVEGRQPAWGIGLHYDHRRPRRPVSHFFCELPTPLELSACCCRSGCEQHCLTCAHCIGYGWHGSTQSFRRQAISAPASKGADNLQRLSTSVLCFVSDRPETPVSLPGSARFLQSAPGYTLPPPPHIQFVIATLTRDLSYAGLRGVGCH